MNKRLSNGWITALAALFLLVTILLVSGDSTRAAPVMQARPTPRPCDAVTETSGQTRQVGQGCPPQTTKAKTAFGGGADWLGVCHEGHFLAPEGVPVWGLYPPLGHVAIGKPHTMYDLIVEHCNKFSVPDATVTFTVLSPSGRRMVSESGTVFTYDFPEDSAPGTYILLMEGPLGTLRRELVVSHYAGPRFVLRDPVTQQPLEDTDYTGLPWRNGIQIDYAGFAPDMPVEVTIYTGIAQNQSVWTVLDSWQFVPDDSGRFREVIQFDTDLPVAERAFVIVACSLDACPVSYASVEPFNDNGIAVGEMAWEVVSLRQYGPQPRASGFRRCTGPCAESVATAVGPLSGRSQSGYFTWDFADVPVGAEYTRTWRVLGKGDWVRYECTWPGPENGTERVTLSEPGGLYSGIWELTIEVDGLEILRERVEVAGTWRFWEPAGIFDDCP